MDLRELLGCLVLMLGGLSLLQMILDHLPQDRHGADLAGERPGGLFPVRVGSAGLRDARAWIFFPLWEMVFVLRQLRVPRHRELADARAPRDEFEELADMTQALVEAGFENSTSAACVPPSTNNTTGFLSGEDGLTQATIGYIAQGRSGFISWPLPPTARMAAAG
jgi:hypothetical protein